ITTDRVQGSIDLRGARIDDLTLTDYRETIKPDSGKIVLLSPPDTQSPYYAQFGWVSQSQGTDVPGPDAVWQADRQVLSPDSPVTLTWTNPAGLEFSQLVAVDRNFMFTVTQRVRNTTDAAISLNSYGLLTLTDTPETSGFWILHEGPMGVFDNTLKEIDYDDVEDADNGIISQPIAGGWIGLTAKYFATALIPDSNANSSSRFVHTAQDGRDKYQIDYLTPTTSIAPGQAAEFTTRLFAGAKEVRLLDSYEENLGIPRFDRLVDFGWFYFLTKPIFYVIDYFYRILGNFGLAILLLTVLIKIAFFPLANKSYRSMSRLKKLQPKMVEIRDRFKDDRQRQNQAMMELYKKEGANPMSGCFPILIQIPVFFALYKVLFVTIEMRHAPFFGWIQDLSAPDPLGLLIGFGLFPWEVPQSLQIVNIGIWPIIMGLTMYLQQKLNPQPADPMQQKVFMLLPIVFTFLLGSFPAGLVIYWAWNNTLSIGQQWLIMRQMGVSASGATIESATPSRKESEAAEAPPKPVVPQGPGKGGPRRKRKKR
ncbi:MAG: membrane protein insertase YidC, partial [Rhodospirillaceae bacterium]